MNVGPGHQSLRKGRCSETGRTYLVTFTTHERRALFGGFARTAITCRAITSCLNSDEATLICWVLMPDHFHALLRLTGQACLSWCVQKLKGRSSMACRKTMRRPAPVWARAFHDHAVRAEEDLVALTRYVIANPVRAGLVNNALDYPWWDADWL